MSLVALQFYTAFMRYYLLQEMRSVERGVCPIAGLYSRSYCHVTGLEWIS